MGRVAFPLNEEAVLGSVIQTLVLSTSYANKLCYNISYKVFYFTQIQSKQIHQFCLCHHLLHDRFNCICEYGLRTIFKLVVGAFTSAVIVNHIISKLRHDAAGRF